MQPTTISVVIPARDRDLGGGIMVRRALPSMQRRLVGPFIFFDHMGPHVLAPGLGSDVRPHPHIGLATVTFLFDGEIVHRDSLGSEQTIRPGDVNWMVAGRGIAHSERTPAALRASGSTLHLIQSWIALPVADEESEPRFDHHPASTLPTIARDGAQLRVLAGTAYGATSPARVVSPTLYVDARLDAGATLAMPDEHEERAAYVVDGSITIDEQTFERGALVVFVPGANASLRAVTASHVMLLGGAPLDGTRHIFWNFVSSSKDRIERAKQDWKDRRFPPIPGDDEEFIPLPE